ncbi:type IV toxin-antitoxin system AbiEi family antitoxin domain-containing protein [Nocardiopsis sediminis]|uniref:Type IV toxin-antitoxin system AbiEi family antitoxin domain-containing protein n=1 Tax=Nocardiopsis sediminis TaxID=1778267 RepID=A0ABV8FP48_9ACTN
MTWEKSFYEFSLVAGRQHGLVTAAQAERAGVAPGDLDHLVEAGLIREHDWSVFQLSGAPLSVRRASLHAAWLALRPRDFAWERLSAVHTDAVLSHGSAARFFGLGAVPSAQVSFTAPGDAGLETLRAATVHTASLAPEDVMVSDGIPVTTPHRTIVDLVRDWADPGEVGRVMADALRRDLIDLPALHADLAPLAGRYDLPSDGPRFADLLLGDLPLSALPRRSLRGHALLRHPDRVDAVQRALAGASSDRTGGAGADLAVLARDAEFARRVAAEIVGKAEADGRR